MPGATARSGSVSGHTRRGAPEGRPKAAVAAGAKSVREFCCEPRFQGTSAQGRTQLPRRRSMVWSLSMLVSWGSVKGILEVITMVAPVPKIP